MLLSLARKMSDHYLLSPPVDDNTFTQVEEESARSPDEEEVMVDLLKTRLDLLRVVRADAEGMESDSDSDSDDEI